jgi:4-amino-4-deoxy-L-arabinose transferase-like glycosyltransferase
VKDRAAGRADDRAALALVALALLVRLVWVLAVPTHPVGDFAMYWESAGYVVEHGALDPEFIYMPGYVLLLAGVRALGGGLLAAKLIGVAAGGLATGAVYGITRRLFGRAAAVVSGLGCAVWPAGIAVSSVTGTDMPAAALLIAAVFFLVRDAAARPLRAAVLFGAVLGLAAYVRAVSLPLAALAAFVWWAAGASPRQVLVRTALGCAVAFVVLLPWGIRNRVRYGELFFTDSHGGHTALVGANPDSDGTYSRSLNQMFHLGTGYTLGAEPHRASDRVAYGLAKQWTAFEPAYAIGLVAAKADRLLTCERPLLYWPIYRQGVLRPDDPRGRWFAVHRAGVEELVDGFWYALAAAAAFGMVVALARRRWHALAILPMPLALVALYATFFAEVRYHLAIAVFMFPFAGEAVRFLAAGAADLARRRLDRTARRRFVRDSVLGAAAAALLFLGWPRLVAAGAELRARHRFAVSVATVLGEPRLTLWRPTRPAPGTARSPVRGVWNGFGLSGGDVAAATGVELPPGRYRISALADGGGPTGAQLTMRARGALPVSGVLVAPDRPQRLDDAVEHDGGILTIEIALDAPSPSSVWISDLKIERQPL